MRTVTVPEDAFLHLWAKYPELCKAAGLDLIERQSYPADMAGRPVTTPELYFNMDMRAAPTGGKLVALNEGNVAIFAVLTSKSRHEFRGWSPMPKIPKP